MWFDPIPPPPVVLVCSEYGRLRNQVADEVSELARRTCDNVPLATLGKVCPVLGRCLAERVRTPPLPLAVE